MLRNERNPIPAIAILTASMLIAGVLALGTSATATATAASDATPATDADSDAFGLTLRAPADVEVGEPFTVTVALGDDGSAAAFEAVLRFDDDAVEFGGVVDDDSTTTTLVTPQESDGVAVAAYASDAETLAPVVARFVATTAGEVTLSLDAVRVVDGGGDEVEEIVVAEPVTISVGDGNATWEAEEPTWTLAAAGGGTASADLSTDGLVDAIDVTEVVLGWTEVRSRATPCELATPRLTRLDLDGSGCLDIGDLQSVNGRVGSTVPALSVQSLDLSETFVVNTLSDAYDNNLNDGVCATAAAVCSLRAAIAQANRNTGPNRIEFALPGSGVQTIQLTEPLPTITDTTGGVTIDGYTQPGSAPNTDPLVSNAQLRVEVRGIGQIDGSAAFSVSSPGNTFRGLSIYNAFYGIRFFDNLADNNTVVGSFIGTNASSTLSTSTGFSLGAGIWFYNGASGNTVGTPAPADRNVLSGNRTVGVKIEQAGSSANVIRNNIIGMNASGTGRLSNNAGFDIQWNSTSNIIGGLGLREGNLISGNSYAGIDLSHTTRFNSVIGNRIGTFASGNTASSTSANGDGILIKDNPYGNVIQDNVISGNSNNAIWGKHNYTDRNYITGNRMGVGLDGSSVPNGRYGIWLTGEDDVIERNVIANNGLGGVYVNDSNGDNNNYPAALTRANKIRKNSFYNNGGLAIDIAPTGQNVNDPGDADAGIQDLLNHPVITAIAVGSMSGTTCGACEVEVYVAESSGEGRLYLGTAIADAGGAFTYADAAIAGAASFTTLAVDSFGNTSEFSPVASPDGPVGPLLVPTSLSGSFAYTTIGGREVAVVPDQGVRNDSGPAGTSSRVQFDFTAPVAGTYKFEAEVTAPDGSADSFWVQVDDSPSNGVRWDVSGGSSVHVDEISASGGADPYTVALAAGAHTLVLSMREDGTGIATLRAIRVTSGSPPATGLTLTAPDPQTGPVGTVADLQVSAVDPDGGFLSYSALNLPPGLTIDGRTGRITGTTTTGGEYTVSLLVNDGLERRQAAFTWIVTHPNSGPTVTNPGNQIDVGGLAVSVPISAIDPDGDALTYSASGLPAGLSIDPTTGVITGAATAVGVFMVTVTATDPYAHPGTTTFRWRVTPGAFVCAVDGPTSTLSWTDQGATSYSVRHIVDGVDKFVVTVSGLSVPVTKLYGTYKVIYTAPGGAKINTTCDGPNPVPGPFVCTVDGPTSTLSWTDQGASSYTVRHIVDGVDKFVATVSGLSLSVTKLYGTYKVIYTATGGAKINTTCDGPNPVPAPFACAVDGPTSTLSWTDQGATSYSVRHIVNGVDKFFATVSGLSVPVTKLYGTYKVIYTAPGGAKINTTCDGPNPVPAPFVCAVDPVASTLTWTDQSAMGATSYSIRRVVNGVDTFVKTVTGATTTTITVLSDTYMVRYTPSSGGGRVDTTCAVPPPFTCILDVGTATVSWSDQAAASYLVRRTFEGVETLVATVPDLQVVVADLDGSYTVAYLPAVGPEITTTCAVV